MRFQPLQVLFKYPALSSTDYNNAMIYIEYIVGKWEECGPVADVSANINTVFIASELLDVVMTASLADPDFKPVDLMACALVCARLAIKWEDDNEVSSKGFYASDLIDDAPVDIKSVYNHRSLCKLENHLFCKLKHNIYRVTSIDAIRTYCTHYNLSTEFFHQATYFVNILRKHYQYKYINDWTMAIIALRVTENCMYGDVRWTTRLIDFANGPASVNFNHAMVDIFISVNILAFCTDKTHHGIFFLDFRLEKTPTFYPSPKIINKIK